MTQPRPRHRHTAIGLATALAGTGSPALLPKPDQRRAGNRRCYLTRSQTHKNKDHVPPTQRLLLTPVPGDPRPLSQACVPWSFPEAPALQFRGGSTPHR